MNSIWAWKQDLDQTYMQLLEQMRGVGVQTKGVDKVTMRNGVKAGLRTADLRKYGYKSVINGNEMTVQELSMKLELDHTTIQDYKKAIMSCHPELDSGSTEEINISTQILNQPVRQAQGSVQNDTSDCQSDTIEGQSINRLYAQQLQSALQGLEGETALLRAIQYAPWLHARREWVVNVEGKANSRQSVGHPGYSFVIIGGGQSEAMGNVDFVARVCDAWQELGQKNRMHHEARHPDEATTSEGSLIKGKKDPSQVLRVDQDDASPTKTSSNLPPINNIVVLSHAAGSPGTKKYDSLTEEAIVLHQALQNELIHLPGRLVIMGFSAGGGVGLELAALMDAMGQPVDQLVLVDPAGMAKHPRLQWEFSVREAQSAWLDEQDEDASMLDVSGKAIESLKSALTSPEGIMSMKEMVLYVLGRADWMLELIREYGMEGKVKKTGIRSQLLMKDSTWAARQQLGCNYPTKVILSPIMLARVVNLAIDRLDIPYSELKAASDDSTKRNEIGMKLQAEIQTMFPHVDNADISLVPNWRYFSHSGGIMDQQNWVEVMSEVMRRSVDRPSMGQRMRSVGRLVWPWPRLKN